MYFILFINFFYGRTLRKKKIPVGNFLPGTRGLSEKRFSARVSSVGLQGASEHTEA